MKRPNILFLLADDMGAWAMRCAGNTDILTPNLDRIAREGARFTNCFCVSPVCSPARASLLTGTIPSRHGVHDWLSGGNLSPDAPGFDPARHAWEFGAIGYTDGLTGYTDLLAQNGYRCALSGKWHMGDSLRPQHGFTDWFTIGRGGCAYYDADLVKNGEIFYTKDYITDVIADDAEENLRRLAGGDAPFYLSVHFTAPHSPWDEANHPKEYLDLYRDCAFTATPDLPPHPWQVRSAPQGTGEARKQNLRGYYAAITAMDARIGRLLDLLEAKDALDDTLVLFTSDNGMNMGHHGIWGKGNGTFPMNMFDTAVKVPLLARYPRAFAPGRVVEGLVSHYDLFPTLRDALSLSGEVIQPLPGKSILPLLRGEEAPEEAVVVFDEYGPVRMIRTRAWKYVHRYPYGPHELYRLSDDPGETKNWSGCPEFAALETSLRNRLNAWFARYADPAVDGKAEPVTGFGQNTRGGLYAGEAPVYRPVQR